MYCSYFRTERKGFTLTGHVISVVLVGRLGEEIFLFLNSKLGLKYISKMT